MPLCRIQNTTDHQASGLQEVSKSSAKKKLHKVSVHSVTKAIIMKNMDRLKSFISYTPCYRFPQFTAVVFEQFTCDK